MNVKIINSKENELVGRREIEFEIEYEQMPTRAQILEVLAKVGNFNKELLIIRKLRNVFGARKSVGIAFEYKDIETLKKFEPEYVLKRWGKVGEEKGEEKQETQ